MRSFFSFKPSRQHDLFGFVAAASVPGLPKAPGGVTVEVTQAGGVAALHAPAASKTARKDDAKSRLLELSRTQKVWEAVMAHAAIVPVEPGTRVDKDLIVPFTRRYETDLLDHAARIGGDVQYEILVTWGLERTIHRLKERCALRPLDPAVRASPIDEIKRAQALAIKAGVQNERRSLVEALSLRLSCIAADFHAIQRAEENIVADFAVRLSPGVLPEFEAMLEAFDRETGGELTIKQIGPLPLWTFDPVSIETIDRSGIVQASKCLGLEGSFDLHTLKQAYYEKVKQCHPDTMADARHDTDTVSAVQEAYVLLRAAMEALARVSREKENSLCPKDFQGCLRLVQKRGVLEREAA